MQERPSENAEKFEKLWPQLRRLLVFQIKLYVEVFRDFFLIALSLGAFLIDVILQKTGSDSLFEKVLHFGRMTERSINLINQHDPAEQHTHSVDRVLNDLEDRFRG